MKPDYLNTTSTSSVPEEVQRAMKGAVCLAYSMYEVMGSMNSCAGQPFLLERAVKHYPTIDLAKSSGNSAPRVSLGWKIGLAHGEILDEQENAGFVTFSVPKYLSTDGLNYWNRKEGSFQLMLEHYAALGKILDEPVPNAYARSYNRITSQHRLFIGNTEIGHFLAGWRDKKTASVFLEKILEELA